MLSLFKRSRPTPALGNAPALHREHVAQRVGQHLGKILQGQRGKLTHDLADFVLKLMECAHRPRHSEDYVIVVATMACEYVRRFSTVAAATAHNGGLTSEWHNNLVFSLISACFVLSINQLDDYLFSNREWAKRVGMSLKELNKMQLLVCTRLDWKLFVSEQEFETQCQQVVM
ncbi:hypothetical protein BASA81_006096 [Batrachochytrium salamandrivorans]|nr:hypothetical protein BASA81_006096 [Batrachochytrium salamandrivorans]